MTYQVRYTAQAREDLRRLFSYLSVRNPTLAREARIRIARASAILNDFPFTCRKVKPANPFLRELIISFGSSGFVLLFEIEDASTVTILAVRHQRQEDFL